MTNPQRILFINYEFPPLGGGGGRACEQIARCLAKTGHEVSVLTSRFRGLKNKEDVGNVQVYRLPTLRRDAERCTVFEMGIFMVVSVFWVIGHYLRNKPQRVICFFSIPCGPAALVLKLLFAVPYIVALRGGDVPGFLPEQLALYHRLTGPLTRLIWKKSLAVTANSKGLAELASRFYPDKKIEVIPNGVDEVFFSVRPVGGHHGQGLKVLTVGRLGTQKKVERLILAMHRTNQREFNNIKLTIVGDGPERKHLEDLSRQYGLLDQQVFFKGWCGREQLLAHYREADVFSLASDYEGMPNVVLEAMAASLAIVAMRSSGTEELVDQNENGFLLHDPADFDTKWIELANNPVRLQEFQNASNRKVQGYSWERVAAEYQRLCCKDFK